MRKLPTILAMSIAALAFAACDRQPKTVIIEDRRSVEVDPPAARTKTFETARLGRAIDAYESAPTVEHSADVSKAFAELDGEIAELTGYISKHDGADRAEAERKLANLREYRAKETARYATAQVKAVPGTAVRAEPVRRDAERAAESAEDAARRAGDKVERAGRKVGEGLKDAADAVRDSVR
jgi:hypothetical protein